MQRLSLGSPAGRPRPSAVAEGADEKTAKAVVRAAAAPDKSIHLVPVLTLLCFLVLFLLSRDPSATAALTDSPVLAVTARSLEAATAGGETAAGALAASVEARGGVYRRLKEDHDCGRR